GGRGAVPVFFQARSAGAQARRAGAQRSQSDRGAQRRRRRRGAQAAQSAAGAQRARKRARPYNGIFPCFFGGFESRFSRSMSSALISRARVSRGSITSSM